MTRMRLLGPPQRAARDAQGRERSTEKGREAQREGEKHRERERSTERSWAFTEGERVRGG